MFEQQPLLLRNSIKKDVHPPFHGSQFPALGREEWKNHRDFDFLPLDVKSGLMSD